MRHCVYRHTSIMAFSTRVANLGVFSAKKCVPNFVKPCVIRVFGEEF
jgi:hypothetical protein